MHKFADVLYYTLFSNLDYLSCNAFFVHCIVLKYIWLTKGKCCVRVNLNFYLFAWILKLTRSINGLSFIVFFQLKKTCSSCNASAHLWLIKGGCAPCPLKERKISTYVGCRNFTLSTIFSGIWKYSGSLSPYWRTSGSMSNLVLLPFQPEIIQIALFVSFF